MFILRSLNTCFIKSDKFINFTKKTMRYKLLFLSFLSGVLLSFAWISIGLGLILLVALFPLLYVEDYICKNKERLKSIQSFYYSYITFITWNVLSTWWIYNSTDWGSIAAFVLNSAFYAIVFWIVHIIKRRFGSRIGYFALVIIWIAWEYIYIHGEISWVWLILGNGFAQNHTMIQWYEFTGTLGGSLWVLITNVIFFVIVKHLMKYKTLYGQFTNSIILILLIVIPLIISNKLYNKKQNHTGNIKVLVVQPNIDPYNEKFSGLSQDEQLNRFLYLADSVIDDSVNFIIGPETAIDGNLWENNLYTSPLIRKLIKYSKQHNNISIVIGATTRYFYENEKPSPTARKYRNTNNYYDVYNSALQITGDNIQIYHKSKLVIGVEMFPYPEYLGFLEGIAINLGGTVGSLGTQKERSVFYNDNNNAKVAPIICYESIYGEFVTDYIKKQANVLFVMTNDGWWGDTPGYVQHLSYSKLRAIETRKYIARSANTGISCIINDKGDISMATKYWVEDVFKANIKLNNKTTFYVKYGDYIGRTSAFFSILLLLMFVGYRKNKNL